MCVRSLIRDMVRELRDKSLLVISSGFPDESNMHYGGIFVKEQLKYLKDYLKEVVVIAPVPQTFGFYKFDKLCKNYEFDNVEVYFPRFLYAPLSYFRNRQGGNQFKVVDRLIKKEKIDFDLIHAHFTWPSGYVGIKLKEKYNVPFVVTAHGYDIYDLPFRDEEWRKKIEYVLNSANYVITVSNSNLEYIKKLDVKTPMEVIPNGFRPDLFYPKNLEECKKILELPSDKKIILTVGNLVEIKGHKYLIEAMNEVVKHRKDVLCIMIGSGKSKNKLEKQIKKLELEDYVKLVGGKPHDKIPIWMNACDLFVLPSLSEGNPTVMFECFGCGKPFIGTKVGGIAEIITSEDYGFLVEPANPEELAERILFALDKRWNYNEIRKYAERFTWENIAKEVAKVYLRIRGS